MAIDDVDDDSPPGNWNDLAARPEPPGPEWIPVVDRGHVQRPAARGVHGHSNVSVGPACLVAERFQPLADLTANCLVRDRVVEHRVVLRGWIPARGSEVWRHQLVRVVAPEVRLRGDLRLDVHVTGCAGGHGGHEDRNRPMAGATCNGRIQQRSCPQGGTSDD